MPRLESAPRAACHDLRVLAANLIRYGNRSVGGGRRRARDVAAVAVAVVAAVAAELRPNACCCRGVLKKRAAAQDPLASLSAARSSAAGPSVCWRRLPAAPQSSGAALAPGFARIAPKIFGRGRLWRSLGRAVPEEGLARRSVMPLSAGRRPARAAHGAPSARSVAGHFQASRRQGCRARGARDRGNAPRRTRGGGAWHSDQGGKPARMQSSKLRAPCAAARHAPRRFRYGLVCGQAGGRPPEACPRSHRTRAPR